MGFKIEWGSNINKKGLCQIVLVNKNQPNTLSGIEISIPEFLII